MKPVLSGWNLKTRIDASVFVQYLRWLKALNFDNSHYSCLWTEYFIDFYVKDGSHVRPRHPSWVFTLPPKESTMQYKRCAHLWNNFPCIINLSVNDVSFSDPLFKVRHTQRPINNQQGVDLTLCLTENALLFIVVYKEAIT